MIYKASSHVALKAMKHMMDTGRHNRRDMDNAIDLFRVNEGREPMVVEVQRYVGITA